MPFLNSFVESYHGPNLECDLLSRGWAEQISGLHASATKAMYVYPSGECRRFVMKFSLGDLLSHDGVEPIWNFALRKGLKVGFMNIPTTYPAPTVEGFFVSGAGGGLNRVEGVPSGMCHPEADVPILLENGYRLDLRLGTEKDLDLCGLFDTLKRMLVARVNTFLELCRRHRPDFSFIGFRYIAVLLYLGYSEIEAYLSERDGDESPGFSCTPIWQNNVESFFTLFDSEIERIVAELSPHFLIVSSDHGLGPAKKVVDLNAFLLNYSFQKRRVLVRSKKQQLGSLLRRGRLLFADDHKLDHAVAFSDWYSGAIYVNDHRYSGPVRDREAVHVIREVCGAFNNDPEFKSVGLWAAPYRQEFLGTRYYDDLPDIKIDSNEAVSYRRGIGYQLSDNLRYAAIPSLANAFSMHSGNKTKYPFFACNEAVCSRILNNDPRDLTLIYKLSQRILSDC